MNNNTILNWDGTDHKTIYTKQLKESPVYWNEELNTWTVYSYEFCMAVLLNNDARIPDPVIHNGLSEKAMLLIENLARLSNNAQHEDARHAALMIFESMKSVSISDLLASLLKGQKSKDELDWVAVVAKKLPVLVVLKGLGFNDNDCAFVTENIAKLVKIMSPAKTDKDIEIINEVVDKFYAMAENYVSSSKFSVNLSTTISLFVCNLIGLVIQSYDAGRGLLTNALINLVIYHKHTNIGLTEIKKIVTETLRLDPPVHNTRRIAVNDIVIGDKVIKAGEGVLVVMAAANLDSAVFNQPLFYNTERVNNDQHLTFGLGGHHCLAKYLSIDMAVQTCKYLSDNYNNITIVQSEFKFEPQLNVRLIKQLMLNLF